MRYPLCGPSNPLQSPLADAERTVNWFPNVPGSPAASTDLVLLPTPGQTPFATTTDIGVRALYNTGTQCFAVVGGGLWELFANAAPIRRGDVKPDANPATISWNGITGGQLFITSGNNGYCYVIQTQTLTEVLTDEATMGGAKDGRFLAFNIKNSKVRLSATMAKDGSGTSGGLTWDSTLFFQRSLQPDPWQAMVVTGLEIWLIGRNTGEVWSNVGTFPQPFAPIPGSAFPWGTNSPWSVTLAGDTMIWLAHTAEGTGQIVAAKGFQPQPVSTVAVANAIAEYDRNGLADDCETLVYQEAGHLFAVFSFFQAQATWVLDLTTSLWHERGSWVSSQHRYDAWHPRVHVHAFGKHLVGERATGVISEMDQTLGLEADGTPIRRLRVGPPVAATPPQRLGVDTFTLLLDTGVALPIGQGSNPTVFLRESIDTRTWGASRPRSAGLIGAYGNTVSWTRCATTLKAWTPQIIVSDPVPWRIVGADLQGYGLAGGGRREG